MKKHLRHFQEEGVKFLAYRYHALLADEPGLGKTLQAIAAVERLGLEKVLVVCPASVRLGWAQELEECLPAGIRGWQIISYQGAFNGRILAELDESYDAIILDESHFLKTVEAKRTQAIFGKIGLARRAKYIWLLSGTPVLNRPRELYPMLRVLHPDFALMSFTAYANKYCAAFFDGYGLNTKGASNLRELSDKLRGFMMRRTKTDVLPELPSKIVSRTPLDVSDADLQEVRAEEALISDRPSKISSVAEDFSQLGDLSRLLHLTGRSKVRAACEFIEELLELTDKIVVFVRHRDVIENLELRLRQRRFDPVVYHGGMSDVQKKTAVTKFGTDTGTRVFIGQIQAAGTGINGLQGVCNTVVFAELSWVPGETSQAIDRVHRIGQKRDCVNVHLLHVPGTLESAVLGVHNAKVKVIERLIGS